MRYKNVIVWRGSSIPEDVQRCLQHALRVGRMPATYPTDEIGRAWEMRKAADKLLAELDPTYVAPVGVTYPASVLRASRDRAIDLLNIYLTVSTDARAELLGKLHLPDEQVLADDTLRDFCRSSATGTASDDAAIVDNDPASRPRARGGKNAKRTASRRAARRRAR